MRVLALLLALPVIACAPPSPTASAWEAKIPLHYCLSAPQARAAFLASNPQALAADVVARRVVILNPACSYNSNSSALALDAEIGDQEIFEVVGLAAEQAPEEIGNRVQHLQPPATARFL
jgi:hypothetical protein